MKPLPHRDEIARCRHLSELGVQASVWRRQAQTAVESLEQLMRSFSPGDYPDVLPGHDLIENLSLEEPEFAEFSHQVSTDPSLSVRIRHHQLQLILDFTAPRVDGHEEAAVRMHDLQQLQREELQAGGWESELAELSALGQRRHALAVLLNPLQDQVGRLRPLSNMLATQFEFLTASLSAAHTRPDPDGQLAWNVASEASHQLRDLARLMIDLDLSFELCFEPMVPDVAHVRHRARLLDEATAVHAWMRTLDDRLGVERASIEQRQSTLESEYRALENALKERMG